jgi:hypothetical protein
MVTADEGRPRCVLSPSDPAGRIKVFGRATRWLAEGDPRVVALFWRHPGGGRGLEPICPGCGESAADQHRALRGSLPPGPAFEAIAVGGLVALRRDLPMARDEAWYCVCALCAARDDVERLAGRVAALIRAILGPR